MDGGSAQPVFPSHANSISLAPELMAAAEIELRRRENAPRSQPGPQTQFEQCTADIGIYGGAAFSGKSHALLMWSCKHRNNRLGRAVIFRRTMPEIKTPGGLWDESVPLFRSLGAEQSEQICEHHFPSGFYIKFAHLQYDSTCNDWDSSQIPLIGFDQLEQFTKHQFFYLLSRNRSMSGIPAQVRGACNPDASSWLAEFIAWWIDPETGYPIPERSGKLRYFVREGDDIVWGDSKEELLTRDGAQPDDDPLSVTFIPGTVTDNAIGVSKNPRYLAKLKGMAKVQRERLLKGNWKIKPAAGVMFQREWMRGLEIAPTNIERSARYWDLAATEKTELNDPDWTVSVKIAKYVDVDRWVILNVIRMRKSPHHVEEAMKNSAIADGKNTTVGFPQDPGQAGKSQSKRLAGMLAGFPTWFWLERGDKPSRFTPFSAQCEASNVDYVLGPWNDAFFSALENFPDGDHFDDADACSGAFEMVVNPKGGQNLIDFYKRMAASDRAREEQEDKLEAGGPKRQEEMVGPPSPTVAQTEATRPKQTVRTSNFEEAMRSMTSNG